MQITSLASTATAAALGAAPAAEDGAGATTVDDDGTLTKHTVTRAGVTLKCLLHEKSARGQTITQLISPAPEKVSSRPTTYRQNR